MCVPRGDRTNAYKLLRTSHRKPNCEVNHVVFLCVILNGPIHVDECEN